MTTSHSDSLNLQCPVPLSNRTEVTMGHGGGGRLTQDLIDRIFRPAFDPQNEGIAHDGAILAAQRGRVVMTTDSHVVSPLFFPGGNIGSVAVNGTVNDVLMCGARPLWLSAAFILEEGFALVDLERIVKAMAEAASLAGVSIVTGDTKVVERGKGDGVYITTTGVGVVEHSLEVEPRSIRAGDTILLSGDIGRHGMAIMATREGLAFESPILSDCACLAKPVLALINAGLRIHCLRDLTRGGLATALVELAETSGLQINIEEELIPVSEAVRGACEILGLDPMYVANEGRFICILPEAEASEALQVLAGTGMDSRAVRIGHIGGEGKGQVVLRSVVGADRLIDRLSGEQLPRIC